MTPKEKAKELVEKFADFASDEGTQVGDPNFCAKECALIAVNEMIHFNCTDEEGCQSDYWQQVKAEIEKL